MFAVFFATIISYSILYLLLLNSYASTFILLLLFLALLTITFQSMLQLVVVHNFILYFLFLVTSI